ncbi:hypothetical protein EYC84_006505 [Monilinia fructicola]|uniref:phosphopyruvate hydratase n=1 Tax=Monilinia fructicola TaxID=38448 RepID=A0A5M9K784_MONFR|nr:hypothetical protein EYC84_006505 [Monilinia fructicola]
MGREGTTHWHLAFGTLFFEKPDQTSRNLSNHQEKDQESNMAITKIHARSVYDSRGNPTVEVDVVTRLVSTVPLSHLVLPLVNMRPLSSVMETRTSGWKGWYPTLRPRFRSCWNQEALRSPVPFMNVLNGGSHAGGRLAFQEFMIVTLRKHGAEVYQKLKSLAKKKYGQSAVTSETRVVLHQIFKPPRRLLSSSPRLLRLLIHWKDEHRYGLDHYAELADQYKTLAKKYPIVSIEDHSLRMTGSLELLLQVFRFPNCR